MAAIMQNAQKADLPEMKVIQVNGWKRKVHVEKSKLYLINE